MIYKLQDLIDSAFTNYMKTPDGLWVPARPLSMGIKQRIKSAWKVLTGKADAVIWPEGQ